jgi:hypothetical protein
LAQDLATKLDTQASKNTITEKDIEEIFGNVREILDLHNALFAKLSVSMGTIAANVNATGQDVALSMAEVFVQMVP